MNRRFMVVLLLFLVLFLGIPETSRAQDTPLSGSIRLVGQSDWVTAGGQFNLDVAVSTQTPEQLDLVVTVFGALPNRSQFQQSLDDHIYGSPAILSKQSLSDVLGPDNVAHVALPVQDPGQKQYYLRNAGIYPVKVELRVSGGGQVVDHFVTHLINEPTAPAPATRLRVTTVLPLQAPQLVNDPLALPDAGASVATVATALGNHPDVPVAMVPEPETLERLAAAPAASAASAASALQEFAKVADNHEIIRTTWAPVAPALYDGNVSGELGNQFDRATTALSSGALSHGRNIDTHDWAMFDAVDAVRAQDLRGKGIDHFIIPETAFTPLSRDTTLARPFSLSLGKGNGTIPAAQADVGLSLHFTQTNDPVLAAHQLLADLAVIWNDRPAQLRAVVVMPQRSWQPNAEFLDTLFHGLENNPVLAPTSVQQFFTTPSEMSGRTTLIRQLSALPKDKTANFPSSRINDTRHRIDGFASLTENHNQIVDELERRLLMAENADLTQQQRDSQLTNTRSLLDHQLAQIHMPSERSLRLTARSGQIPVSIQSDTGYPVHVVVALSSDKLEFPGGSTRSIELERRNITELFTVEARTSGAFPVQVRLESPDGSLILVKSLITVRSTATSAIGVGLSIGAGGFLVIWWLRHILRTRRTRKQNIVEQNTLVSMAGSHGQ